MSTQTRQPLTIKSALAILNSRTPVTRANVGQQAVFIIQGSGTFMSKEDQAKRDAEAGKPAASQYFDKYIYNLKANSQEALSRPENRELLKKAYELAGGADDVTSPEIDEILNEWLNSVQISFNVIADRAKKFENGDMVTAIIGEADTAAGHKALVVNDVRYKAPVVIEKVKFAIDDLLYEAIR